MDTIWNCAFGVDIQVQENPDNEYFLKCENAIREVGSENLLTKIAGKTNS